MCLLERLLEMNPAAHAQRILEAWNLADSGRFKAALEDAFRLATVVFPPLAWSASSRSFYTQWPADCVTSHRRRAEFHKPLWTQAYAFSFTCRKRPFASRTSLNPQSAPKSRPVWEPGRSLPLRAANRPEWARGKFRPDRSDRM